MQHAPFCDNTLDAGPRPVFFTDVRKKGGDNGSNHAPRKVPRVIRPLTATTRATENTASFSASGRHYMLPEEFRDTTYAKDDTGIVTLTFTTPGRKNALRALTFLE